MPSHILRSASSKRRIKSSKNLSEPKNKSTHAQDRENEIQNSQGVPNLEHHQTLDQESRITTSKNSNRSNRQDIKKTSGTFIKEASFTTSVAEIGNSSLRIGAHTELECERCDEFIMANPGSNNSQSCLNIENNQSSSVFTNGRSVGVPKITDADPSLNFELLYFELLQQYEALVNIRETASEALLRDYREAAEKRFREKLQTELEVHTVNEEKKISNTDQSDQFPLIDIYSRMLGISVTRIIQKEEDIRCWNVSIKLAPKIGGSFDFILREPGYKDDVSPMIEYIPITLSINNECKEQCLRILPKEPPQYLFEPIIFKSASLSTFIFNIMKWIRSVPGKPCN